MDITNIVEKQREYFHSGITLSVDHRLDALRKLKETILEYEDDIAKAVKMDLGKSAFETYMCESGMVLSEISYMMKHLKSFAKEKTVWTPLAQFCSRSYQKPSPYGVVLIMSPWNYPFMLTLDPLVDAIAAGNTAILKPSAYSPNTSALLERIVRKCFPEEYVAVVSGGREENKALLEEQFDYIFFTGSQAVGKVVMKKAAEHLTPVTLELGGKSPCIVLEDADIRLAAKRIVFGKYLNCGQTCVAPDYIYCQSSVKKKLIKAIRKQIIRQYGKSPLENEDYGKIINEKHYQRLMNLMDSEKIIMGGEGNEATLQIAPTLMDGVGFDDPVMQEEIFGPILPILTFDTITDVVNRLHMSQEPLALYIFTSSKKTADYVMSSCNFGGGCINDTIIHLATSEMGFGGCGASGMGSYHGKAGFDTFTHYKSIVDKKTFIDLPMRYQKYKNIHNKLIHMFLK